LHFQQPYDAQLAERTVENAKIVIEATKNGELLPRAYSDPGDWRCGLCPHARRCWGALWVERRNQGGGDVIDDAS
jgi:hypothetical protein